MRPILSIFLALIITILVSLGFLFGINPSNAFFSGFIFIIVIVTVLGGGMATWFSTKNKTRYSVYYSVIFALIFGFFSYDLIAALILVPIFAGTGGTIAKNEKNTIKNLLNNKYQGKYKSFFINLYKRNKIVLSISLALFFASVLIGGIGPYLSSSFNHFMINDTINYLSTLERTVQLNTLSLFINNSIAALIMYMGGIFFGITSIIELHAGFIIGFTVFKYPFTIFYLLPHGIFELSSYIIACAAGFKLFSMAINIIWNGLHIKRNISLGGQVNNILNVNYLKFRDSLTLFIIAIALLFIAAIIEAHISLALGNYITGQNTHSFGKNLLNLINH